MDSNLARRIAISLSWERHCTLATIGLLIYDYFLTLPDEVVNVWPRRLSFVNGLFYLNRYLALLVTIPLLLLGDFYGPSVKTCQNVLFGRNSTILLEQVIVALILAARTYALYKSSKRFALICSIIATTILVLAAWLVLGVPALPPIQFNGACAPPTSDLVGHRTAGAWALSATFDTLIFSLTLYKSWQLEKLSPAGLFKENSLMSTFFRDGALYYAAILSLNTVTIISYATWGEFIKPIPATFSNGLSSIMMTRMVLHLRKVTADEQLRSTSTHIPLSGCGSASAASSTSTAMADNGFC